MRAVVDSNFLRDLALECWLTTSEKNVAVITDYVAMEALKGDPNIGVQRSMEILIKFPMQVAILKSATEICGIPGISKGMQRRMIDHPQTNCFVQYCRALLEAREGNQQVIGQIANLGRLAREHFEKLERNADAVRSSGVDLARRFTREEWAKVRSGQKWSRELFEKWFLNAMALAALMVESHPMIRKYPTAHEILHTYIFRSAMCSLLLGFDYADVGGATDKATHRITNDIADCLVAAYGTFYDTLLTKDMRQEILYDTTKKITLLIGTTARI